MCLESDYLKAKKITDYYESKLKEKNNISNLESLYFELRKRTNKVEADIHTVRFHVEGYFDNLILGHITGRSCNWYMYIHDYRKCRSKNSKFENDIHISMMYSGNFILDKWFSTIDDAINYIQSFYLSKKDDFEFNTMFQPYYLKLNDIITGEENYLL